MKLSELSINLVPKCSNPPAAPESRPTETFWSHLKAKVNSDGFKAHYTDDLIKRIKNQIKNWGHHILRFS